MTGPNMSEAADPLDELLELMTENENSCRDRKITVWRNYTDESKDCLRNGRRPAESSGNDQAGPEDAGDHGEGSADLDEKEYTTSSGGGAVEVLITGKKEIKSIMNKPEVVDPEDIEILEDMIMAAVNEAIRQWKRYLPRRCRRLPANVRSGTVLLKSNGLQCITFDQADRTVRTPAGYRKKSAQRLAFYVLNLLRERAIEFADAIREAHEKIRRCSVCQNLSDKDVCYICENEARDRSVICVVESPRDIIAFERTKEYNGLYHVLHGLISPMDGIGPDQIYL
jgi:DNA-binding protein YbaB